MSEESKPESGGRWLTAEGARIYALICLAGSFYLSYSILGPGPGGLFWVPLLGAVVLVVPLYLLLRVGDRLIDRWWKRRSAATRRTLRRLGCGAEALFLGGAGIWLLAIAVTTDSRSPTFALAHVLFGAGALTAAGFAAWMAVKRERAEGGP